MLLADLLTPRTNGAAVHTLVALTYALGATYPRLKAGRGGSAPVCVLGRWNRSGPRVRRSVSRRPISGFLPR